MTRALKLLILGSITGTLIVAAVAAQVGRPTRRPTPPSQGASGFAASSPLKSVGETIDESQVVVVAETEDVGEAIWNSPDGSDWTEEFDTDPSSYLVSPITVIPVTVSVRQILLDRQDAPNVSLGDQLQVMFLGTSLSKGEDRVFFLQWTDMFLSQGSRKVWYGNDSQGTWSVELGLASPMNDEQSWSVATALLKGKIKGKIDKKSWKGSVDLQTLESVVADEAASPAVSVAGFRSMAVRSRRKEV